MIGGKIVADNLTTFVSFATQNLRLVKNHLNNTAIIKTCYPSLMGGFDLEIAPPGLS